MKEWLLPFCIGSAWPLGLPYLILLAPILAGIFLAGRQHHRTGLALITAGVFRLLLGLYASSLLQTAPEWKASHLIGTWCNGEELLILRPDSTYATPHATGRWRMEGPTLLLDDARYPVIGWDGEPRIVSWSEDLDAWPGLDLGYRRLSGPQGK